MKKPPSEGRVSPLHVRRRPPRRSGRRQASLRFLFPYLLLGTGSALVLAWGARPFLQDRRVVSEIREVRRQVLETKQASRALMRRARTLNTKEGIEAGARGERWAYPGEVLVQLSGTPPPLPSGTGQPRDVRPPLGAVRRGAGALGRALSLASRALARLRRQPPTNTSARPH